MHLLMSSPGSLLSAFYRRLVCAGLALLVMVVSGTIAKPYTITTAANPSYQEKLAAKEIRRYLYLRTGEMMPIVYQNVLPAQGNCIVIGGKTSPTITDAAQNATAATKTSISNLASEHYLLNSFDLSGRKITIIVGGDSTGILYGTYGFCEKLGVWFDIDGDVIPDSAFTDWGRIEALNEVQKPLFEIHGTNPFHDFPEGPDLWDLDDYKATISQMAKMRMNMLALHTYPYRGYGPIEPTTWIGPADQVNADGTVKKSYQSSYATNARDSWGYKPKNTGTYAFGASQIFEADTFASEFMAGLAPKPKTPAEYNLVFNTCGALFNQVFTYAKKLGIKSCIGTESPLDVPNEMKVTGLGAKEYYEGIFTRIKNTHPLDYYWCFTPENWKDNPTASNTNAPATVADLKLAYAALNKVLPDAKFAICGWVIGPSNNKTMFDTALAKDVAISALGLGCGASPPDPVLGQMTGRPKWAIPWLEGDPGLIQPQLHVKSMLRDAKAAAQYNCSGLLAECWRTKPIGMNYAALAQLGWNQTGWTPDTFYVRWANAHFGPENAKAIGKIFTDLDGNYNWVSTWGGPNGTGPGWIKGSMDTRNFNWVTTLENIRPQIKGKGNLDRFDYWLNFMRYFRELGANNDKARMWKYLLATLSTKGEMGTLINLENHNFPTYFGPVAYNGDGPRLILTTVRTSVEPGETMTLKARILDSAQPKSVTLKWRQLGQGSFASIPFTNIKRGVYSVVFPKADSSDLEYYVEMQSSSGKTVVNPATAPLINNTLVVPGITTTSIGFKSATNRSYGFTGLVRLAKGTRNNLVFSFVAGDAARATFTITDLHGRTIQSFSRQFGANNPGTLSWDARNSAGTPAGAGMYLMRMRLFSAENKPVGEGSCMFCVGR